MGGGSSFSLLTKMKGSTGNWRDLVVRSKGFDSRHTQVHLPSTARGQMSLLEVRPRGQNGKAGRQELLPPHM